MTGTERRRFLRRRGGDGDAWHAVELARHQDRPYTLDYLVRFCDACGRMERNLKVARCARCGALLPVHGMTSRLHRDAPVAPARRARLGRR